MIEALRRGEVAVVMPFRYSLIPYGVLAGIVAFGEWPDMTTLLGISIVLTSGLYALHRERIRLMERKGTERVTGARKRPSGAPAAELDSQHAGCYEFSYIPWNIGRPRV